MEDKTNPPEWATFVYN